MSDAAPELAELRDFLAAHPPFDALPHDRLDELAKHCSLRYARRETQVLRAGTNSDRLFVVRSGAVDLTDEGRLVDRVGAGGSFGLSAVVEHTANRHDATAREDTLLITLPQSSFDALVADHPGVAVHFAATHHGRIRAALGQLQQSSRGSAVLKTSVRDLLRAEPVCGPPDATITEAARIMTEAGVSSLLVMDDDRLVGILTDRDLRSRVVATELPTDRPIREVMTPDPRTVTADALALEVLLEMTGRGIHHLPVVDGSGTVRGLVTAVDLIRLERANPVYLVSDIARQPDVEGVVEYAARIPRVVEQLVAEDATAEDIGKVVTAITDAVTVRLIELAEEAMAAAGHGPAPAAYAWVALGSAAREEQALGGDQDHGLVLADDADAGDPWWRELAERVTAGLEACGYPRCDGDVMATNPQWRRTVAQWHSQFADWSQDPEPQAVLWAAVFYDMRPVHGEFSLVAQVRGHAVEMAAGSDLLLAYLAHQSGRMKPPIGFFRRFVLADDGAHRDTLDIKRGITAIVQIARVQALRAESGALSTRARIEAAQTARFISAELAADLADAHELMSYLRLQHQVALIRSGESPNNHVDPDTLSSLDRRSLRDAFTIVRDAQQQVTSKLPRVG